MYFFRIAEPPSPLYTLMSGVQPHWASRHQVKARWGGMSQGQDNFSKLMQRIRHGSREAARELVEVYGFRLV